MIETRKKSLKRCDYVVDVGGVKIYVWCEKGGCVKSHYFNSNAKPPEELENKAIEILRAAKQGDPFFDSAFGNPEAEGIYI